MGKGRLGWLILPVTLAALLLPVAPSEGSITFGTRSSPPIQREASVPPANCQLVCPFGINLNLPAGNPSPALCGLSRQPCMFFNTGLPSQNGVTSPINGVIAEFILRVFPTSAAPTGPWTPSHFQVIKQGPRGPGDWIGLGISTPDVTPADTAGNQIFGAGVPVGRGQYVGLYSSGSSSGGPINASNNAINELPGATMDVLSDRPYPGRGEFGSVTVGNVALQLEAVVEPDRDCDGYGDQTQDNSPAAASAGACACPPSRTTIVGTTGNDVLVGTPQRDVIKALSGNDKIIGLGGNDVICADDGNDTLLGGPGNDLLVGGPGRDRVNGGPGRNRCSGQVLKRCQVVLPLAQLTRLG